MERSLLVYNGRQYNNIFSGAGNLGFIAPGSHVTIKSNPLTIGMLDIAGNDSTSMIRTSAGLVKRYLYTDENSPVKIRCLLAIATNEYYDQPTFYDTPFWISDIIPSSLSPKTDFDYSREKFYMSKEREGLKLLGYTVAILLSLVLLGASG